MECSLGQRKRDCELGYKTHKNNLEIAAKRLAQLVLSYSDCHYKSILISVVVKGVRWKAEHADKKMLSCLFCFRLNAFASSSVRLIGWINCCKLNRLSARSTLRLKE